MNKAYKYIISLIIFSTAVLFRCTSGDKKFTEEEWRHSVESKDRNLLYAPHYKNNQYFNPWMPMEEKGFLRLLEWKMMTKADYTEEEENYLPEVIRNAKEKIVSIPGKDFILWVGHNTFLLRINEEYWITDPIFSERALLPKRKTPPGISIDDLKKITNKLNVIITHNHHDHLDKDSILALPDNAKYYVPMGLKKIFSDWGIETVFEMDWWQRMDTGKQSEIVCLPAQHWSRRINQGYNESLWASFMLITQSLKIYFGGDSGYFIGYKEIGKKFPEIDYAFLPVTAYHPRWFMHYAHMNVEEAIEAFGDIKAACFIPTQWGTFRLGDNPAGYPPLDLKRKIKKMNLPESKFIIMNIGEVLLMDKN